MLNWRVLILAALAVLLLTLGLIALILPSDYEGEPLYQLDENHTIRTFDALGGLLLGLGCVIAWTAGILWQRRINVST